MVNPGAVYDLVIIGGGINGAGLARDAAGRGLSVLLCEQDDLANGTSSASSKLIHGGLRYLEYFEFRLVREALAEREVLLGLAPHLIHPMRFVLPLERSMRPAWMIRLGLFLYDHLSGRKTLKSSRGVRLRAHSYGAPLQERFVKGFVYSDCWVDDSRLVVLNALDAARLGADILTRSRFTAARREGEQWRVSLRDTRLGEMFTVSARMLVNAAGPWVDLVMREGLGRQGYHHLSLVKGSHIVVPRIHEGDQAYILQNTDRRVIFVLPFQERFSLIGTTDIPIEGDPGRAACEPGEIEYLCAAVNRYMKEPITPADVVWSFAGVRPLYDDASDNPSAVSREYVLELEGGNGTAPLLSIIGGKITAYRQVAEHAMEYIADFFPKLGNPWSAGIPLPGGDFSGGDPAALTGQLMRERPGLPQELLHRLARSYGTLVAELLGDAMEVAQLGHHFGAGLYQCEVEYLMRREWARTAEDVLWRRGKLGLFFDTSQAAALQEWMESQLEEYPPPASNPGVIQPPALEK